ncbi:BLUF domain-containing protein [Pseudoalteromonas tunicata]|uniref:BLUF domain-containing protein n=1 Tax=Pseudoalteromonas tunicata TaxID=314281 RepID=UPI00273EAF85|nr:BLUF domain-containing protein [Pseudoalteromonas tunicata]MDP5215537.1 BLUF domain-containing protein [Pseudoalteromonas tunicata]
MIELIYVSKAQSRFSEAELKAMLVQFRKNNKSKGITGLMLYDGYGTFIQVLEGDKQKVQPLYQLISKDPRHTRVNLLGESQIEKRSFPDWKMGFKNLADFPITNLDGYSNFLAQTDRSDYLEQKPSFALELMDYFRKNQVTDLDKG